MAPPLASTSDLIGPRRPAETAFSAAVSVSPSASLSAISLASVPVRTCPSCLAALASIDASEEAKIAPG